LRGLWPLWARPRAGRNAGATGRRLGAPEGQAGGIAHVRDGPRGIRRSRQRPPVGAGSGALFIWGSRRRAARDGSDTDRLYRRRRGLFGRARGPCEAHLVRSWFLMLAWPIWSLSRSL